MPADAVVVITVDDKEATKAVAMAEVMTSPMFFATFLRTRVPIYFRQRVAARFQSEGDDASGAWKQLTEATIRIRESEGYPPGPINVRAGDLRRAMTSARGRVSVIPDGAELTWPSDSDLTGPRVDEKFQVAQVGSPRQGGFGPTPARPVVAANAEDLAAILELLSSELKMSIEHGMDITVNALGGYEE